MRQHIRHRTCKINEISARYSELDNEFYVPALSDWKINTANDKQIGVDSGMSASDATTLYNIISAHDERSYKLYKALLDGDELVGIKPIAREQARMVLGVNVYTQCIWKMDLRNLLHYIGLRADTHAQYEIRVYADAIAKVVEALFPYTWKSFKDNFIDGVSFSGTEIGILNGGLVPEHWSTARREEFNAKRGRIHSAIV
jgi:thymidylate synthase (FAD)